MTVRFARFLYTVYIIESTKYLVVDKFGRAGNKEIIFFLSSLLRPDG